jgi:hypothetical protein
MEEISNTKIKEIGRTLTDLEAKQIAVQRQFENLKEGSSRFKIGLYNDVFRKNVRIHKQNITRSLWTIGNFANQAKRLAEQLTTGKITQELLTGVIMTEGELRQELKHLMWSEEKEVFNISQELWKLAQLVGTNDVMKKVIISEQEFDTYYNSVEGELNKFGFSFDE